ncbi:MAG: MoxR family ATPase [Acidobacteriaceae bacterium]|nr:MoxR family ATPase [Acidobacteriaceae bacterium]
MLNASSATLEETLAAARHELAKVIIGQEDAIRFSLVTILTGQHALVEGVPGLGKTLLVRTLARILRCDFQRIQFTPDLMPSDITGTSIFNLRDGVFEFHRGPVFTSFLLADEINRAPAKTQAALLQAMQERTVTVDGVTHPLPSAFTVFATQNPIEFEGTYPLPEAQKDRFLMKIKLGWPERDQELELARRMLSGDSPQATLDRDEVVPILEPGHIERLRSELSHITLREELVSYMVDLVRRTRSHEAILSGAGPRATQALLLASRALAAVEHRDFVTPDDVRILASPVLEHRILLKPEFEMEGTTTAEIVSQLLADVPVPR